MPFDDSGHVETSDGSHVAWRSAGRGRPVVFVHGITLDGHIWKFQTAALADRFRVVTVDQRGHGESSMTAGLTTAHRLGEDLAAVLCGLDLEGAIVVGHSLGGIATLRCLLDHAEARARVGGTVLVSTLGTARVLSNAWLPVLGRLPLPVEAAEELLLRFGSKMLPTVVRGIMASAHVGRLVTRFFLGAGAPEAAVAGTQAAIADTPGRVLRDIAGGLATYHTHDELHDLDVPALVVCGDLDLVTPLPLSEHLVSGLPAARLAVLEGAGHMPMWEQPDTLTDLIAEFADGLPAVSRGEDSFTQEA
ncbi:MAG: alpha/beta hydrolase [Acidimicrobiia bacterium]|nr:alpha/beta hydrolase [Acidimicrobiia bacterium]